MLVFVAILTLITVIVAVAVLANRHRPSPAPRRPAQRRPCKSPTTITRTTANRANGNGLQTRSPIATAHRPIQKLYGPDRIGIVGFHDSAFIIAVPAEPFAQWLQQRSQLLHQKVGGMGTNLTDGLRKAVEMADKSPRGVLKRIWLLTDGYPNRETDQLNSVLQHARKSHVNVNTIGFGDSHDETLLKRIAGATHNGKFVPVRTLRELTKALLKSESSSKTKQHRHQSETTILAIDLSPSMNETMEGKRKVSVVEEAVLRLLHYKRECFA